MLIPRKSKNIHVDEKGNIYISINIKGKEHRFTPKAGIPEFTREQIELGKEYLRQLDSKPRYEKFVQAYLETNMRTTADEGRVSENEEKNIVILSVPIAKMVFLRLFPSPEEYIRDYKNKEKLAKKFSILNDISFYGSRILVADSLYYDFINFNRLDEIMTRNINYDFSEKLKGFGFKGSFMLAFDLGYDVMVPDTRLLRGYAFDVEPEISYDKWQTIKNNEAYFLLAYEILKQKADEWWNRLNDETRSGWENQKYRLFHVVAWLSTLESEKVVKNFTTVLFRSLDEIDVLSRTVQRVVEQYI